MGSATKSAIDEGPGEVQVRTINSLDFAHAGETSETLLLTLDLLRQGSTRVVLDLGQADGLDLAGIQVLAAFTRSLARLSLQSSQLEWKLGPTEARIRKICVYCGINPQDVIPGMANEGA